MEEIDLETARASGLLPKLRPKAPKPTRKRPDPWDGFVADVGMLCRHLEVDPPMREFPFALVIGRHWRFDLAWINYRVAIEREGGTWAGSHAHATGRAIAEDCVKYSEAAILGWVVLRFTTDQIRRPVRTGTKRALAYANTLAQIERALMSRRDT
jgi:hypothetical protein